MVSIQVHPSIETKGKKTVRKKRYQAAIIGTGRIGFSLAKDRKREQPAAHTAALKANPKIELIAGCDTNPDHLKMWLKENKNAQGFSDIDTLLQEIKPDLFVVAVNESSHLEVTQKVIRSKPLLVLLEKPVALHTADGLLLKKESEINKVPILVNHERRYAADYRKAKELIQRGVLGTIQFLHASLWSGLCVYSKEAEHTGAYSLIHDGTHLIDIVHFLLDEKLQHPIITNLVKDRKGDVRDLQAVYQLPHREFTVIITLSGRSRYFGFDLDIRGSEGRILIGNGYFQVYKKKKSPFYSGFYSLVRDRAYKKPSKTGYFCNMIKNCVAFLDGEEAIQSTLEDGLNSLEVLEEIKNKILE